MENVQTRSEDAARGYVELVSAFPNGVLVLFDEDFRYRIVGPDVLPFSGRLAAEMEGKSIYELFPERTSTELETELRETIDGSKRSFDMEYDGEIHHIETRPVTIDDEPFGVLVTQNVTEERATTAELAEKTQRLETVATVLSHDLRNPLNVALGNLEVLAEELSTPHDSIATIRRALTRMDTIMADALVLAQETTLTDLERIDLGSHARAAWELVPTNRAALDVEGTVRLAADPSLLGNLFENLIRNAVAHAGHDVTVRVGPLNDDSGFYVEDDGPGIDPDIREAVLDSGFTTGLDDGHTGLGLAIVGEVASAHGWELRLTDGSDGGARFEFTGVDTA